jgi:hypothetical protein
MKCSLFKVVGVLLLCGLGLVAWWFLTRPDRAWPIKEVPLSSAASAREIPETNFLATGESVAANGSMAPAGRKLPPAQGDQPNAGDHPNLPRNVRADSHLVDAPSDTDRRGFPTEQARSELNSPAETPAAPVFPVSQPLVFGAPEIALVVPVGERAPAVFYDETPRPEPQMRVLDQIAREFNELVAQPVPGYTPEQIWRAARDWADERYMYFFGWESWHALHLAAAKEAVREKEAMAQLP